MIDLTWSEAEEAFRHEARTWLTTNLSAWKDEVGSPILSGDTREGFAQTLVWEKMLSEGRWAAVSWPEEYGGRDATPWEWLIFEEEYSRAGGPARGAQNGIFLLAPSLYTFGTKTQQDYILPRLGACEDLWCQGWSEPNSGSDLASLRSRATKVEGGWVLNGQKTWSTRGAFCTHVFGIFRSDPESERHRGLTYLMVPLDLDGITVRGFSKLGNDEGFAEIFFEDAFVPDELPYGSPVLGEVGKGWTVAMATTGSERGLTTRTPARYLITADRLFELYRACGSPPHLRDRIVTAWTRAEAYRVQTIQSVTDTVEGRPPGPETSYVKVWWSELDIELQHLVQELLGPEAEVEGSWSKSWIFSLAGTIYAGTNEVQRNIAAERVLGLPRR